MARGVDAVLFDLDGTLADSEAGIVASYRHALGAFGIETSDEAIRQWIGPPLVEGFAGMGVPAEQLRAAIDIYRQHFSTVGILHNTVYPGVAAVLRRLGEHHIVVGVATSKLSEYAVRIVHQLGLSPFVQIIAGSTRDGSRLHKEEIVAHALAQLGRAGTPSVAMVGDREHDIRAARHHGLRPIGVTWGYGSRQELIDAGAVALVDSPRELLDLLL